LSYSPFLTSQTGGQQYSDTSPFSVPWFSPYLGAQDKRTKERSRERSNALKTE